MASGQQEVAQLRRSLAATKLQLALRAQPAPLLGKARAFNAFRSHAAEDAEEAEDAEANGGAEGHGPGPLLRGRSAAAGPAEVQRFGASWSDDDEVTEREQEWAELNTVPHAPDDPDRAYA